MALKLEDYMEWPEIEALEYAECKNPELILGPNKVSNTQVLITAFFRNVEEIYVKVLDTKKKYKMEKMDEDGYFATFVPAKQIPDYHFIIKEGKQEKEIIDPYAFPSQIDNMDINLFNNGIHDTIYKKLGAHPMEVDGSKGTYFAVWAPNARAVSVVGDFNGWDNRSNQMKFLEDGGIFELFIPGVNQGDIYKYEIWDSNGRRVLKADPYAAYGELRPNNASIVWDLEKFEWSDKEWLAKRKKWKVKKEPVLIYEISLSTFKKDKKNEETGYMNYRDLAGEIVKNCSNLGYTHVELMPIMEYPYDQSLGYQTTGYYAPTSRFGTPDDFKYFVDLLHKNEIGIILDWSPTQFPKDEHGLINFDGTCLYEHLNKKQSETPWGTLAYNFGRDQIKNFLIANALFWIEEYHIDGIRMDAVASILYLDYGKTEDQWIPNIYGGRENLDAIDFIQKLTEKIHNKKNGAIIVAEESADWPGTTKPVDDDGLGFDFKWNQGWVHDYLEYIQMDPLFRKGRHGMLSLGMIYQYTEEFCIALDHNYFTNNRGSMFAKMPGDRQDKFANLRLSYGYMLAHPGKKLLFMGQEFGSPMEWNDAEEMDWSLLNSVNGELSEHERLRQYVGILNEFYKMHPAMYRDDDRPSGFEWISTLNADDSMIAFTRKCKDETLLVLCNFTPVAHEKFRVGVPFAGKYKEIFNSDNTEYGGSGVVNPRMKSSKKIKWDGRPNSLEIRLAPLSIQIFNCTKVVAEKKKA